MGQLDYNQRPPPLERGAPPAAVGLDPTRIIIEEPSGRGVKSKPLAIHSSGNWTFRYPLYGMENAISKVLPIVSPAPPPFQFIFFPFAAPRRVGEVPCSDVEIPLKRGIEVRLASKVLHTLHFPY